MTFDAEAVRRTYDTVAGAYADKLSDELDAKPLDRWLLERIVEFADGGPILDAGCGPGHVAGFLVASGAPDVTGFDLSPAMVAEARRRHPGIPFEVGDLRSPPASDGGWACIVVPYSLVHFQPDELPAVLGALADRLRPGGHMLIGTHAGDDRMHLDEWLGHDVSLDFVFHSPERLASQVADAGLSVDEVIVRSPYEGVEHPNQRVYVLASQRS